MQTHFRDLCLLIEKNCKKETDIKSFIKKHGWTYKEFSKQLSNSENFIQKKKLAHSE